MLLDVRHDRARLPACSSTAIDCTWLRLPNCDWLPNRVWQRMRVSQSAAVWAFLAAATWLGTLPVWADDDKRAAAAASRIESPVAEPHWTKSDVAAELQGGSFESRQQAMWRLWSERDRVRIDVERAARDPDPEVAERARWILDRWRRGLLPETPPEIVERLRAVGRMRAIESLMEAGHFVGALVAIEEALTSPTGAAAIDRARTNLVRRFPFHVRKAHEAGQLHQFGEIVDRLADDPQLAICYQSLLARGDAGPPDSVLPSAAVAWAQRDRDQVEAITLAGLNRLDEALDVADRLGDEDIRRVLLMLMGQWGQIAKEQRDIAVSSPDGSDERVRAWSYALIGASRSGDRTIRSEAIESLSPARDSLADSSDDNESNISSASQDDELSFARIRWQVLAMHGEVDRALLWLKPSRPAEAAELLAQATRYTEAFEAIGIDPTDLEESASRLVGEALRSLEKVPVQQNFKPTEALQRLLTAARLATQVGHERLGYELLREVAIGARVRGDSASTLTPIFILQTLLRMNRMSWIESLTVADDDQSLSPALQFYIAKAYQAEPDTAAMLVDAIGRVKPHLSFADRLRAMLHLLDGQLPPGFDASQDYDRLHTQWSRPTRGTPLLGGRGLTSTPKLTLDVARLFEIHGQADIARSIRFTLAERGDVQALLSLADAELNEGSAARAMQWYEHVWSLVDENVGNEDELNPSDEAPLVAMRAVLGQSLASARLGDSEGADRLREQFELMLCSPSPAQRSAIASHLSDIGFLEEAVEVYRQLIPIVAFGSEEGVEFYSIAMQFSRALGDAPSAEIVRVLDLAISGTIETTAFVPAAYLSLPAMVARKAMMVAIDQGDADRIADSIEDVLRLDAVDIDFGEKVLGRMRESGMDDLARQTLERIRVAGRRHLDQFPLDISTCNNLAWILALADHRLDEALELSRRAVTFAPDSTVYRDTLAEVLFRSGRTDEAISIAKACLLDDAGEWHVHQQLQKFAGSVEEQRK